MKMSNTTLLLIWKDPLTRRNFVVGKLKKAKSFTFEYYGEYKDAMELGWGLLEAFPEEKLYESDVMFPVFSSRLPDRKRRDITQILKKYSLNQYDEFELLRRSQGRLPIDTYEFIDPIFPNNKDVERDFFIMGVRYYAKCKGENCEFFSSVSINDSVLFRLEPQNPKDTHAIRIETTKNELLGYVPRYYSRAVSERLIKSAAYSCNVIEFNRENHCSECIKVRLKISDV